MVNDGTESVDLVKCKDCIRCTRMELEEFDDGMSIVFSEWMCMCSNGEWHPESDDSECPMYCEDKTRR